MHSPALKTPLAGWRPVAMVASHTEITADRADDYPMRTVSTSAPPQCWSPAYPTSDATFIVISLRAHPGDIDDPILKGLKRRQRRQGQPLGRLVSDPLAVTPATRQQADSQPAAPAFPWIARPMNGRVDVADKDAILDAIDPIGR